MRRSWFLLVAALAAPGTGLAADQGEVVWVDTSCNHFIAKVHDGFAMFNWRSGGAPQLGDRIEGNLLSLDGEPRDVQNARAGAANIVYMLALGRTLYAMVHSAPVQCKERFRSSSR